MRIARTGSLPVAGRPGFRLGITFSLDVLMILVIPYSHVRNKRGRGMKITDLEMPKNGGSLCWGFAESRGAKYRWCATVSGECCDVFMEQPDERLPEGCAFWLAVETPPNLTQAVKMRLLRELN